jgi:putative tryptophan/tyrosine transport system substrate-binding protein
MRRRAVINALIKMIAGSAVALSLAAHAQQPAIPVIGFLSSRSAIDSALQVATFRQALSDAGYATRSPDRFQLKTDGERSGKYTFG